MSPSESRSGSNPNRVRMFGPDKLVRAAAEKRWDRVRIVCSQPYSKDAPYGLSFVRFHSPPDKDEAEAPAQVSPPTPPEPRPRLFTPPANCPPPALTSWGLRRGQ